MVESPETVPRNPSPNHIKVHPIVGCCTLIILAFIFGFIGMTAGTALGGASASSNSKFQEVLLDGEESAEKKIAVIPIEGLIMESMGQGPGTVSQVKNTLKALEEDDTVVGVLLVMDTPGGGVTASDRIYHDLTEFKKKTKLPIHSVFLDVSASGGYYIAMASDHITAHPTTVTGSIGVISKFFNFSEAMDKVGISVNVVKSLNSKGEVSFKDIGSPYRPMRPEERELMQGLITEMWEKFTDVVATGREGKLTRQEVRDLADGRVFTGRQALELKLVDAVGYMDDAYVKIREAAGAEDAKIVSYSKKSGLAEILGFSARADKIDQLAFTRELLSRHSGFLYLWTAGSL